MAEKGEVTCDAGHLKSTYCCAVPDDARDQWRQDLSTKMHIGGFVDDRKLTRISDKTIAICVDVMTD